MFLDVLPTVQGKELRSNGSSLNEIYHGGSGVLPGSGNSAAGVPQSGFHRAPQKGQSGELFRWLDQFMGVGLGLG